MLKGAGEFGIFHGGETPLLSISKCNGGRGWIKVRGSLSPTSEEGIPFWILAGVGNIYISKGLIAHFLMEIL